MAEARAVRIVDMSTSNMTAIMTGAPTAIAIAKDTIITTVVVTEIEGEDEGLLARDMATAMMEPDHRLRPKDGRPVGHGRTMTTIGTMVLAHGLHRPSVGRGHTMTETILVPQDTETIVEAAAEDEGLFLAKDLPVGASRARRL